MIPARENSEVVIIYPYIYNTDIITSIVYKFILYIYIMCLGYDLGG